MIVIINLGTGNLGSISNMLDRIGITAIVSSEPSIISKAEKLILPGVGAFDNGMKKLNDHDLLKVLNERVIKNKVPILGICLGIQLFTRKSEEGQLPGLGWIDAETVRFKFDEKSTVNKIPHTGWNTIQICRFHSLFVELETDARFYFVHSYHLVCKDESQILAKTDYGYCFPSVVAKGNIVGVQFHPEKSHKYGMKLLKNFVGRF